MQSAAVIGSSFFGTADPDNFATFDAAFVTLFYVTGGDPWPDSLPKHNEDGTANWEVSQRARTVHAVVHLILRFGGAFRQCYVHCQCFVKTTTLLTVCFYLSLINPNPHV